MCTNASQPCRLHDKSPELYIPIMGRDVHWGWWITALVLVIVVSIFV